MKNKKLFQFFISLGIIWIFIFVFLPSMIMILISFLKRSEENLISISFTINNYMKIFNSLYFKSIFSSLCISLIVTFCCLFIGYPFAFILSCLHKKLQTIMVFFLIIPFWINSILKIYGLKMFLSIRGKLNEILLSIGLINKPIRFLYTNTSVLICLIHILLPFMIMPIYSSIKKINKSYIEAAKDLGAHSYQILIYIILPMTIFDIFSSCILVLLTAMGLFYVSDLIGGSKSLLVGNIIKNQFLNFRDWPLGSAISVMLVFLIGIFLFICYKLLSLFKKDWIYYRK
ncbi:spermidine/putrescine ABC transporter permease [Candidatus Riesia sp. GBBU]|nr:spermidine/putrescine ABC transporter permease [Candidatus Riesia sp. GBBU]